MYYIFLGIGMLALWATYSVVPPVKMDDTALQYPLQSPDTNRPRELGGDSASTGDEQTEVTFKSEEDQIKYR